MLVTNKKVENNFDYSIVIVLVLIIPKCFFKYIHMHVPIWFFTGFNNITSWRRLYRNILCMLIINLAFIFIYKFSCEKSLNLKSNIARDNQFK